MTLGNHHCVGFLAFDPLGKPLRREIKRTAIDILRDRQREEENMTKRSHEMLLNFIEATQQADRNPPADVLAGEDGQTIVLDVPGVAAEDITVKVEERHLIISGHRQSDEKPHHTERWNGSFTRSFRLSDRVDESRVKATLKNGVLRIHIPYYEASKPRTISVQVE